MLIGVIFFLSACQGFSPDRSDQGQSSDDSVSRTEATYDANGVEPTHSIQPANLPQVVEALDRGQIKAAEATLLQIIDQQPFSTLALRFLEQIQTDPVELMGEEYDVVLVQPGDSLSEIAERELGDALQFFALARYNGIDTPRQMPPGIELKIPQRLRGGSAELPPADGPAAVEFEEEVDLPAGAGLALAGQSLYDQGQIAQAFALLSAGARAGNLDPDGEQFLAQIAVERSEVIAEEGRPDDALALLNDTSELISDESRPLLKAGRRSLEALGLEAEAVRARRAGELSQSLALFEQAAELNPDREEIRSEAANVREVLVAQLHDQALIHYRDQQLNEAIELWQQVANLAPDFESAQIYLERALALRQRLRELD